MSSTVGGKKLSTVYVCIDEYGAGRMEGRLYSPCLYEPLTFYDANHFFVYMEQLLDYPCYPQAFQRKRSFGESSELTAPLYMDGVVLHNDKNGRVATGEVHITSRLNTSWQGFILWRKDNRKDSFSSDLELLSKIHEYCSA